MNPARWEKITTAPAPQIISTTDFQSWELRRYLATHDPTYLHELEAAA